MVFKKETFISDGRKIQVNSSKKYVKFFSSGNYFPSEISPLILIFMIRDWKITNYNYDIYTVNMT